MANKIKYPFTKMQIGDFNRLHFNNKIDVCRAQMVSHNVARYKGFVFKTEIINFMLEITRLK